MEVVQIFQAERLSKASQSGNNRFYLVFREVGGEEKPQLTNIDNRLEKIVTNILEEQRSINFQFPEMDGIIYHQESGTHYRYQKVDKDAIDKTTKQFRSYLCQDY